MDIQGQDEGVNYFERLPLEMKEKILLELNFKDKLSIRGVCQSFKEIVDRKTKLKFKLTDKSLGDFAGVDDNRLIDVLAVTDLTNPLGTLSKSRSKLIKNVRHLKLLGTQGIVRTSSSCDYCGHFECPENIAEWIPGRGTSEENVVAILRLHPDISQLTLGPMCFEHVERCARLSVIRMESLTRLNISFGDELEDLLIYDSSSPSSYTQFLKKNTFPSLQTFVFDNKACSKPIDILLSVYEFVSRHHATLHTVNINSERSYEYLFYPKSLQRWIRMLNAMSERIKMVQLKKLMLRTAAIIPPQMNLLKTFEENFIQIQKKLEYATVSFIDGEMSTMLGFLPACMDTLKSLRVDSGIYKMQTCPFDCGLIKDCKNLTYLDLDVDNREWSWFSTDRTAAKIENVHLLPSSILELRIEGHLPVWKSDAIFQKLQQLRKFTSTGYGRYGKNLDLLKSVLKKSTIEIFILDHDKCPETLTYSRSLNGLDTTVTWSGYTFRIDRTKFDRYSV